MSGLQKIDSTKRNFSYQRKKMPKRPAKVLVALLFLKLALELDPGQVLLTEN